MEMSLTAEQVLEKIRSMHQNGAVMTKRQVKKTILPATRI